MPASHYFPDSRTFGDDTFNLPLYLLFQPTELARDDPVDVEDHDARGVAAKRSLAVTGCPRSRA